MLDVQPKLLGRAIEIAGGHHALCQHLGISDSLLRGWLHSRRQMPDSVFLQLVDLVLKDDIAWASQDRRDAPRHLEAVHDGGALSGTAKPERA